MDLSEIDLARGLAIEQAAQLADRHDISRTQSGYKISDLIRSLASTDAAQALAAHDKEVINKFTEGGIFGYINEIERRARLDEHERNPHDELCERDGCLCVERRMHYLRAALAESQPALAKEGEKCEKCGQWNPVWFVANELWNKAMPNRTGMLCPSCFIKQADKVISNTGWQLVPERPAPEGEPQPQAPEGEK